MEKLPETTVFNKLITGLCRRIRTLAFLAATVPSPQAVAGEVDTTWGVGATVQVHENERTKLFFNSAYAYRHIFHDDEHGEHDERNSWHILQNGLILEISEAVRFGAFLHIFNDNEPVTQLGGGYMIAVYPVESVEFGSSGSYSVHHKHTAFSLGFELNEEISLEALAELEDHHDEGMKTFVGAGLSFQISEMVGLRVEAAIGTDKENSVHTAVMLNIGSGKSGHAH